MTLQIILSVDNILLRSIVRFLAWREELPKISDNGAAARNPVERSANNLYVASVRIGLDKCVEIIKVVPKLAVL